MRESTRILRYLIPLVVLLVTISGGLMYFENTQQSEPTVLRVAFPSEEKSLNYDPARIHFSTEYIFLENIYSPLVEFDKDGVLQSAVSGKTYWDGDHLVFEIRKGLKTENGTPITAQDAAFSLKRLLVLSGNTHGNFQDLVCPGIRLKSVNDACPGIRVDGDKLILTAKGKKTFLLPMLAAIDFAIIPESSVDRKTLEITNMKETSGAYYVAKDDGHGHIQLRMNPYSFHASPHIAQEIDIIPLGIHNLDSSLEALLANKVDHITTVDRAKSDLVLNFAKDHPEFNLHVTHRISTILLVFTKKGQDDFSPQERRLVGEKVREVFEKIYRDVPGMESRDEFLPELNDGALTSNERTELHAIDRRAADHLHAPIRIGLLRSVGFDAWAKPLREALPSSEIYSASNLPDFQKNKSDEPDAFICTTDSSFMEDIGFITYSINAGFFGMTHPGRSEWISKYMEIEDKTERMTMIRSLQYRALTSPVLVPILAFPYTALVRKPWKMEFSTYYADDPFWLIKHP